jgi:hypothetical protein
LKRSSLLTLLAILIMFAISIVLWALDMADFIMEIKLSFIVDPDLPLSARLGNARLFIFPNIAAIDALYAYMVSFHSGSYSVQTQPGILQSLIGDGIIIWRVWNLKSYYRPWVIFIPLALLFGSLGKPSLRAFMQSTHLESVPTLMLTYCVAKVGSEIVVGTFQVRTSHLNKFGVPFFDISYSLDLQKPAFCRNVQTATYAMACATTTTATILIGLTTWNFRKAIRPLLSGNVVASEGTRRRRRSPVENILLLLVESGILYFLFFVWPFSSILCLLIHPLFLLFRRYKWSALYPRCTTGF